MKKRILGIVLTLCMVLALMPQMVFADESDVDYRYCDENGANWQTGTKKTGEYTLVTSGDTEWIGTADNPGWYVVQGDVTISSRVKVNGDVHLILTDGCTLTVNGGIGVNYGNNLTIYGQENGTGELNAYAASESYNAGIGGSLSTNNGSTDTITINGGNINAVGAGKGSGIGGTADGGFESITINGGIVTATGGEDNKITSGIGQPADIPGRPLITISGGTVIATGSAYGISASDYGTISTGNDGHAVIFASYTDSEGSAFHMGNVNSDKASWSGVIFEGNIGQVYGEDVTPSESFEISAGKTLTIGSGKSLTIPAGKRLTVNGTLTNSGKIYVDGTLSGTVSGDGDVYYNLDLKNCQTTSTDIENHNGKTYAKAGNTITLTPDTPQPGYVFDKWEVSSASVTINNNTFFMPSGAIKVEAQYKDIAEPVISGIEDGTTYCSAQTVTVTDNDTVKRVTVNGDEVTLDKHNQFTLSPAVGAQEIIAIDNAENSMKVKVTVNDGHTYGAWQSNGDGKHTHYCTVEGCNGYEDGDCEGGTATCTELAICDTCKKPYGELDSSNHNLEKIPAKDATVTETGNKEYWHCKDCGKYFSDENGTNEIKLADTIISKLPPETTEETGQSITDGAKTVLHLQATASKTSIKLKWNALPEADGYVIYWNKCGAKNGFKQVKVIESGKILTWTHKNLKKNTWNKYYVKAYKLVDGKKSFIKTSNRIHLTTKGGKYTNVKKLKSGVSSVTLNKGKTKTLKITQIYVEKNKKIVKHMRPLTYTTSDKTVATVTSKGVIKAKGTGSCYIYITAHNGVYTRVKVTVK